MKACGVAMLFYPCACNTHACSTWQVASTLQAAHGEHPVVALAVRNGHIVAARLNGMLQVFSLVRPFPSSWLLCEIIEFEFMSGRRVFARRSGSCWKHCSTVKGAMQIGWVQVHGLPAWTGSRLLLHVCLASYAWNKGGCKQQRKSCPSV